MGVTLTTGTGTPYYEGGHREDIVAVTDGLHGAEFHRRDGFKIHAVALGDVSAGIRRGRLAEVLKALALAGRRT
ncbi:hypothetical protein ABZS81_28605 [Streptomyces sp. NPDC005318]|uniref:hypothetical protein n=1 Tax=Streptomyces sp. NPDC005318 TaxID=3157031 RepID=UPI0033B44757